MFRGPIASQEVDDVMNGINNKHQESFVEWIPNNIKVHYFLYIHQSDNTPN